MSAERVRRRDGRRLRIGFWVAVGGSIVALGVAGTALLRPDVIDRVAYPKRYATSGTGLLPLDRYVATVRSALPVGDRIAVLRLPDRAGPVEVTAVPATGDAAGRTVYLDPPTGRVLDIARGPGRGGPPPIARAARPVEAVVARAAAMRPGRVRWVVWPGAHSPDWTVAIGRGVPIEIKVSDDGDVAAFAHQRLLPDATRLARLFRPDPGTGTIHELVVVGAGSVCLALALTAVLLVRPTRSGARRRTGVSPRASRPRRQP